MGARKRSLRCFVDQTMIRIKTRENVKRYDVQRNKSFYMNRHCKTIIYDVFTNSFSKNGQLRYRILELSEIGDRSELKVLNSILFFVDFELQIGIQIRN